MVSANKKPFIIGITGGSGSGKTFFLNCFLDHFSSGEVSLLSQDNYYISAGEMSPEENRVHNFDLPAAIDDSLFLTDLQKLMSGQTVYKEEYTFHKPGSVPKTLTIHPAPLIIVEGLFILHFEKIAELLDLRIFIETDEDVALQRRLKRDLAERGYTESAILYKWTNHFLPAYADYLLPYKNSCARIIRNNTDAADNMMNVAGELLGELRNGGKI
jgi:uridine kinase